MKWLSETRVRFGKITGRRHAAAACQSRRRVNRQRRCRLQKLEQLEERTLLSIGVSASAAFPGDGFPTSFDQKGAGGEVEDHHIETVGQIEGSKWNDLDGDGFWDQPEEPGLAGVEVYLDLNDNGRYDDGQEPLEVTGADGSYQFVDLDPGEYVVREIVPDGFQQTFPGDDAGTYYGAAYAAGTGKTQLVKIDAETGEVTWIGTPMSNPDRVHGLVRANDGRLFGTNYSQDSLYEIDAETGQPSLIGPVGYEVAGGLAYDSATDTIYGLGRLITDDHLHLMTFDRTTGAGTLIGPGITGMTGTSGLAFDPLNNRVIAFDNSDDEYYAFDTAGNATLLSTASPALHTWSMAHNGEYLVQQPLQEYNNDRLAIVDPDTGVRGSILLTFSEKASLEALDFVPGTPFGHRVVVESGQTFPGVDFGNRANIDFGDAPEPTYPTLAASNGAGHVVVPGGPFLGAAVDAESDGQPTAAADGDDLAGVDDEDGVTIYPLVARGDSALVEVDLSSSPADGYLNAWVDFNADGDWADPGEQILIDVLLTKGVLHPLDFAVPLTATPGQTYARFRVSSAGGLSYSGLAFDGEVEDYALEIPDRVHVYGTAGNDIINFDTDGTTHTVEVNAAAYVINDSSDIRIYAQTGDDTLRMDDLSSSAETAYLDEGTVRVDGPSYQVQADSVETVRVYGGGGGDEAYFTGSSGNDRLYSYETYSYLKDVGSSFFNYVRDFAYVEADLSTTGGAGSDRAYLYDSAAAADDTFSATPTSAQMDRGSDSTVDVKAIGFDIVRSDAAGGGPNDKAYLEGSAGDDRFYCYETHGSLAGLGYYLYAGQYSYVQADATAGSDTSRDRAWLFGSPGDDTFYADPTTARMDRGTTGADEAKAIKFDIVRASASGGNNDAAYLIGSSGDDQLYSYETYSYLKGTDYYNLARDFDRVHADATPGAVGSDDRAYIYGSDDDDDFRGDRATSRMDRGTTGADNVEAIAFDVVKAYAKGGTNDVGYLEDCNGNDRFYGYAAYGYMKGPALYGAGSYYVYAMEFDQGTAAAPSDFPDSDRADLFPGTRWTALGDWENIINHSGPGSAALPDLDLGFARWIAQSQHAKATSAPDGDTDQININALDWLFAQ